MKKLLLVALVFLGMSCDTNVTQTVITGKPYEVFVITSKEVYNSVAGDTLKTIFNQEVEWVNQPEPIYDMYNITPEALNSVSKKHRNLIFVRIDPKYEVSEMSARYDAYAKGQICIDINSPTVDSAATYIYQNKDVLVQILDKTERDRFVERVNKYAEQNIEALIQTKFGFHLGIPRGYTVRDDADNFLWLSNEMPLASQGVVIYTFPADSTVSLLAQRNMAVAKIPGPSKGSFMVTDTLFRPELKAYEINGREWREVRGFWKVEGDFMGGPFLNYTTLFEGHYVAIDMYVLSNSFKYGKRNYLRQMEALPLTFSAK